MEVLPVDVFDDIGPSEHEVLVAPFVLRTAEIVGRKVALLDHRPHRAVEHENPFVQRFLQLFRSIVHNKKPRFASANAVSGAFLSSFLSHIRFRAATVGLQPRLAVQLLASKGLGVPDAGRKV
jgi:hypothetical protein